MERSKGVGAGAGAGVGAVTEADGDVAVAVEFNTIPALVEMEFDVLVRRYRQVKEDVDALEGEKKKLSKDLEACLIVADRRKVSVGELTAVRCNGRGASSLSATRLLELGVDASIIGQARIPGAAYTYVQVVGGRGERGTK